MLNEMKTASSGAINEIIDSLNWTFAKTMPDIPHEYILRLVDAIKMGEKREKD